MTDTVNHLLAVFFAYFAIMNPFANTAVFLGLTGGLAQEERVAVARRALLMTFIIIVAFAVLGNVIFHFFGITLPALRIAGGVLVFLIGYQMQQGENSSLHKPRSSQGSGGDDVAISPLAVPILAGPGTIATTVSFTASNAVVKPLGTLLVFAVLCLMTFVCFVYSHKVVALLGQKGLSVMTRLMGLILAVIGVQMLIEGVYGAIDAFPG
ncbi:MAG: hypothetical protein CL537_04385 [Alcanivoracaceae bacterium]|nr:hypothetical protein [Alcanivoracaceae bacterium]MED5432909.1 MarC family protein [Pseudomonadota bacterium]|tara:strand:+ start:2005 stop:2634 length:630 start_codon:yes stop_codon:yes gene_type:complete